MFTEGMLVDAEEFFAPAPFDLFDTLMSQYRAVRTRLEAMAEAVSRKECEGVLHYFIKGNCDEQKYTLPSTVGELFELEPAIAELDADFWDRALKLTDVLDIMPQKRRQEWYEQIKCPMGRKENSYRREPALPRIPEFTEDNVRTTLESLIAMRSSFFAERVDGIFQRLSREHVTNCPQGFGKRMILLRAINSYSHTDHDTAGYINDLRCVVAKFMGRDEPSYNATDTLIQACKNRAGKWVGIDGGALRMRVYAGVGTAHLEVHPDMAWRLNGVLASLHPMAIPAEFRERPKRAKKTKEFDLINRPLPFKVLELLNRMKEGYEPVENPRYNESKLRRVPNTLAFDFGEHDPVAKVEAERVLTAIGGVSIKTGGAGYWAFDYEVRPVLTEIICSGVIPDHRSHQFYPTPAGVAERAIAAAEIQPGHHRCLEPSAGLGGLADLMPRGDTLCVEISPLHAKVLEAKGHKVTCGDFLNFPVQQFDRIVMNPPFDQGRWQAHLEHAASMVAPGGRLVAILPASARGKALLSGFMHEWSDVIANEFAGTSVSVVIGTFDRA